MVKKRKRRTLNEIRKIRSQLLETVNVAGKITLSQLVGEHGEKIGVKNTPSDKNLAKKQLDQLAKSGQIDFVKIGRDLVAKAKAAGGAPAGVAAYADSPETPLEHLGVPVDLVAIRAYARQVEEFARTMQGQIKTLVRMVEKATT